MLNFGKYFHTLYQNPKLTFDEKSDNRNVKANEDIKYGELLLIEHIFHGELTAAQTLVACNENLYNSLCPRNEKWTEAICYSRNNTFDKVQSNSFIDDISKQIIFLGKDISIFNHSCNPNALVRNIVVNLSEEYNCTFFSVYAMKTIRSGEEVTIRYSSKFGHEAKLNNFVCDCKKSLTEREKIEEIIKNISNEITKHSISIDERDSYIGSYMTSNYFDSVVFNQYWANKGFYSTKGDLVIITKRLANYLEVDYNLPLIKSLVMERGHNMLGQIKKLKLSF